MNNKKNGAENIVKYLKQYDYLVCFALMFFLAFTVNFNFIISAVSAYVYAGTFFVLSRAVNSKPVTIMQLLIIFVPGFLIVSAILFLAYKIFY